jgi:tungstate transport system substrate-binding protein
MLTRRLLIIAAVTACLVTQGGAQDKCIVVASTTSTQDSGLFGYLLPIFIQKTGSGDRSGTHIAEIDLWKGADIDIAKEKGHWYRAIGQGMGAALNMASASNAYVLSDRGTWLALKNRGDLMITVEGDKRLFNQYGVMLVNPVKQPNVKVELGQQFVDWLISPDGQNVIAGYKINGQQLFYPNADDPNA